MRRIIATADEVAPLIARLALGIVMFPHGAQKVFGWFGGYGFAGTMGFLTGTMHLPYVVGVLVILIEFLGSLGLIFGVLGRIAALGVAVDMIGAVVTTHLANGFFMNWSGQQKGEGYEYHLLVLALALIVMIRGSGRASVDRVVTERRA